MLLLFHVASSHLLLGLVFCLQELIEKRRRLVKEFKDYQEKKKRAMAKWRTNNVSQCKP